MLPLRAHGEWSILNYAINGVGPTTVWPYRLDVLVSLSNLDQSLYLDNVVNFYLRVALLGDRLCHTVHRE